MLRCIICNQSNLLTGCTLALVILYVMNLILFFFSSTLDLVSKIPWLIEDKILS